MEIAGFTCWSPVSARDPTIPNQLPTKKLLWERYKKTSKGRPKGWEKREKGYYTEISSLDQVWRPLCLLHFPHLYRKPLSPCVLMFIHYLWYHGVSHGRSLLKAWGWMDLEWSFAWSPRKVTQVKLFLLCILFVYNKETRLGSWYKSSLCLWYSCWNSYVNGCLKFITNYLPL